MSIEAQPTPIIVDVTEEITTPLQAMCEAVKAQLVAKGAEVGFVHAAVVFLPANPDSEPCGDCHPSVIATFGADPLIMGAAANIAAEVAMTMMAAQAEEPTLAQKMGVRDVH